MLLAVLLAVPALWGRRLDDERQRRADYYFMEALRRNTLGDRDMYYMLLRRASELNPEETSMGVDLGFYNVAMFASSDSSLVMDGVLRMKRHFDSHPEDYYSSLSYGTMAAKLGMTGESIRVWSTLDSIFPTKTDVALNYAEVLAQTGDSANLRKAIEIFSRMERVLGPSLMLSGSKMRAFMALTDTVGATTEIENYVKNAPADVAGLLTAGDLNMALGRPDTAIIYYDKACATDSTSGPAFYKRAAYYHSIGDSARYDAEILESLTKDNLDLDVKVELMRAYLSDVYSDSVRQPQIEWLFNKLIDMHPHEVDIHKLYTSYLVAVNDFQRAAEQQSYALDIDPSNENDWRGLFSLYVSANDNAGQLRAGKSALRYFPESPELNWYTSAAMLSNKMPDSAAVMARHAFDLQMQADSTNYKLLSSILCTLGDAFYATDAPDSAFVYYEKSLNFDPDNMLALNNCAYYMACRGIDLDRAEKMSERTVADDPHNTSALDTYAWILFKKQEFKKAREVVDQALEEETEPSAEFFHHAGDIYFMSGDPKGAVDYWKKALKLEPDNKELQRKVKQRNIYE